MGNEKPDDSPEKKSADEENEIQIEGLTDEVDESAQTVLFQRAINPDQIKRLIQEQESEETKIMPAIDKDQAKRILSDEELNRIVDEVKLHGALPMDTLPSSVNEDEPEDDKE